MPVCAYLSPESTFSGQFARKQFPDHELLQCTSFGDLLDCVIKGECDFAVAPLENTNDGSIFRFQREMLERSGKVFVTDLFCHEVLHYVYSKCKTIADLKEVRIFEHVVKQVSKWTHKNTPLAKIISLPYKKTTDAVESLVSNDDTCSAAAVGSKEAEIFQIPLIAEEIQNNPNFTTFCRIERCRPYPENASRALVAVADFKDEDLDSINQALTSADCSFTSAWTVSMAGTGLQVRVMEIASLIEPFCHDLQLRKLEKNLKNSFYVGCYFGKTLTGISTASIVNQKKSEKSQAN